MDKPYVGLFSTPIKNIVIAFKQFNTRNLTITQTYIMCQEASKIFLFVLTLCFMNDYTMKHYELCFVFISYYLN